MDTEYLINGIYNKTIDNVLINTKSKNSNVLRATYKQYLITNYGYINLNEEPYNNRTVDELIDVYSRLEIMGLEDLSENEKLSLFVSDNAYDEIRKISSMAYKYAEQRAIKEDDNYIPKITMDEAKKLIDKLFFLQGQLQEFNQEKAEGLISAAVIELLYASNQSDVLSLRLAGEYNHIKSIYCR